MNTVTVNDCQLFKTLAWQSPGSTQHYLKAISKNKGSNALRNTLETNLVKRFVYGRDVLDIGIGTGRAAWPLIEKGHHVTGVDASEAMLDEAARLARGRSITLKLGDLFDLPCEENQFDCAVSLNVLAHFTMWQAALKEWKRTIRPGGRVLFDTWSLDHITAALGKNQGNWPSWLQMPDNPQYYYAQLSAEELSRFANEAGYSIMAMVPYGAFLGGGNPNLFFDTDPASTHSWERLLSWFATDHALFELGLFLEEAVIAHLTPQVAMRVFVVLENRSDPQHNAQFLEKLKKRNTALQQGDMNELLPFLDRPAQSYTQALTALLKPLRCRVFFFRLFQTFLRLYPSFHFRDIIPPSIIQEMNTWLRQVQADQQLMEIIKGWPQGCQFNVQKGVDITQCMEWGLAQNLVTQYFRHISRYP